MTFRNGSVFNVYSLSSPIIGGGVRRAGGAKPFRKGSGKKFGRFPHFRPWATKHFLSVIQLFVWPIMLRTELTLKPHEIHKKDDLQLYCAACSANLARGSGDYYAFTSA